MALMSAWVGQSAKYSWNRWPSGLWSLGCMLHVPLHIAARSWPGLVATNEAALGSRSTGAA
eukprot:8363287-Pyramimonas_sp.AAC.1